MTDLVIRPLTAGEEDLFESLPDPGLVGFAAFGDTYTDMAAAGEYRPGVDLGGPARRRRRGPRRLVGGPNDDEPLALDWFDFTDSGRGGAAAAHRAAARRVLPQTAPGWRDDPAVREPPSPHRRGHTAGLHTRSSSATGTDGRRTAALPRVRAACEFRPEPDDAVILDMFRRIHQGSLDAHARRTPSLGPGWTPPPRKSWTICAGCPAHATGGGWPTPRPVISSASAVAGRNYSDPVIGYIGVVPEHRGHGYAYDLLVEATHMLVDEGADRIVAGTDRPTSRWPPPSPRPATRSLNTALTLPLAVQPISLSRRVVHRAMSAGRGGQRRHRRRYEPADELSPM